MLHIKINKSFEVELTTETLFIRVGRWERFYNRLGLPSGA